MSQAWHETRERTGDIKSIWTIVVVFTLLLAVPSGASAKSTHPLVKAEFSKQPGVKKRTLAISECKPARLGLVYYKLRYRTWLELRGIEHKPRFNFPRGCAHTLWRAKLWQSKAAAAKVAYFKWLNSEYVLKDFEVKSGNQAWFKAITEAQKPYPDTDAWLKSCSASEGGWGRWVPNSDGAPPGGWMQMYESTFWRMWSSAIADLKTRGYSIAKTAHSWYSPLGQALASAWGYTHGRRGEWSGGGCYLN